MDYAAARHNMVESQIRPNRVTDPLVISAIADVAREAFVPKNLSGVAYVDDSLALGGGRYLIRPLVLARLLQAAEITADDVVLDIGCGPGYAAAVLARLASAVVALESDPALAAAASKTLGELEIDTVAVVEGRLEDGYSKQGPYDVIFFNGAVSHVPERISDQLAEGGRLVAVISSTAREDRLGKAMLYTRVSGILSGREIFDAFVPLLPGFEKEAAFVF